MTELLVNIDVDDIDRAVRFYTSALPLSVGRRLGPDFVELLGGGVPIYLLMKTETSPPIPGRAGARSYERHWTPVHLDFAVDDLEAASDRAIRAGATLEAPMSEHAYGRMALFADPFGHGFCLLEFNEQGYDAIVSA